MNDNCPDSIPDNYLLLIFFEYNRSNLRFPVHHEMKEWGYTMNYYIVDDNIAVIKVLENLIRTRGLGTVAGSETDPEAAVREIARIRRRFSISFALSRPFLGWACCWRLSCV